MPTSTRIYLISLFILLPLIAGLIRLRRLDKGYQPFYILLCIGFVTETISYILIHFFKLSNAIPVNIYNLIEWIFLAWQFRAWGFLKAKPRQFYALLSLGIGIWATENIVFGGITGFGPYFCLFYYFVIVLLSIGTINFTITHDDRNLFRKPKFLICIGFIIYFFYMIIYYWAEEVSAAVQESAASAQQTAHAAEQARAIAREGVAAADQASDAMVSVRASAESVTGATWVGVVGW